MKSILQRIAEEEANGAEIIAAAWSERGDETYFARNRLALLVEKRLWAELNAPWKLPWP